MPKMRSRLIVLLLCWISVRFLMADDKGSQPQTVVHEGYIDCSLGGNHDFAPSLDSCQRPSGNLPCGEKLVVVERQGTFLKVQTREDATRYIRSLSVSQASDKFVPFDEHSGIPEGRAPNCPFVPYSPSADVVPPKTTYSPNPEYSKAARKAKYQGTCVLTLIVGEDGKPRDIKVTRHLDYGLDEKAIEAVKQWRFTPATRAGQPVPLQVNVQVSFHLY